MKIWAVGVTLFQADTETDMMTPWSFFSAALQNAPKNSSTCIMELMKILHTALTPISYTQMHIFLKMIHLD